MATKSTALVTAGVLLFTGSLAVADSIYRERRGRPDLQRDSPACRANRFSRGRREGYAVGRTVPFQQDDQLKAKRGELIRATGGTPGEPGTFDVVPTMESVFMEVPLSRPIIGLTQSQNKLLYILEILAASFMNAGVDYWVWGDLLRAVQAGRTWPPYLSSLCYGVLASPGDLMGLRLPGWLVPRRTRSSVVIRDATSCYLDEHSSDPLGNGFKIVLLAFRARGENLRSGDISIPKADVLPLRYKKFVSVPVPTPKDPEAALLLNDRASPRIAESRKDSEQGCM